jgi:hypothetical protein
MAVATQIDYITVYVQTLMKELQTSLAERIDFVVLRTAVPPHIAAL